MNTQLLRHACLVIRRPWFQDRGGASASGAKFRARGGSWLTLLGGVLMGFSPGIARGDQTVYIGIPQGCSLFANPVNAPDNTVTGILPSPPEGTLLCTFRAETQSYEVNQYQHGRWTDPGQRLDPGHGAVLTTPSSFGLVLNGGFPERPPKIVQGWNLLGLPISSTSPSPLPAPAEGDKVFVLADDSPSGELQYRGYVYSQGGWSPPLRGVEGNLAVWYLANEGEPPAVAPRGGTLLFSNYVPAFGLDSRMQDDAGNVLAGSDWWCQLFVAKPADPLVPAPAPSIRNGVGRTAGYLFGGPVEIPGCQPGDQVRCELHYRLGDSAEAAALNDFPLLIQRAPGLVTLGGSNSTNAPPTPPAALPALHVVPPDERPPAPMPGYDGHVTLGGADENVATHADVGLQFGLASGWPEIKGGTKGKAGIYGGQYSSNHRLITVSYQPQNGSATLWQEGVAGARNLVAYLGQAPAMGNTNKPALGATNGVAGDCTNLVLRFAMLPAHTNSAVTPQAARFYTLVIGGEEADDARLLGKAFVGVALPVANPDSYASAGTVLRVPAPGVLDNDSLATPPTQPQLAGRAGGRRHGSDALPGAEPGLQAALVRPPLQGLLELDPDGAFTYTLTNTGFEGEDCFSYVAWTGSPPALVHITIPPGKKPVKLTLGNLEQVFNNQPRPVTVTTDPSGLGTVNVFYSTGGTNSWNEAPTQPGTYAVTAVLDNPGFEGAVAGQLEITLNPVFGWEEPVVNEGKFQARAFGTPGLTYVVESTSEVNSALWTPLARVQTGEYFKDSRGLAGERTFYRLVEALCDDTDPWSPCPEVLPPAVPPGSPAGRLLPATPAVKR